MSGPKQPQLSRRDNTEKTDAEKLIRGYPFGTVASALQKEVRRGDLESAVYWGLILYEAAPQYAWKRVLVTAGEDIGFGDPDVVAKVCSMATAWKVAKEGSWYVSPQLSRWPSCCSAARRSRRGWRTCRRRSCGPC